SSFILVLLSDKTIYQKSVKVNKELFKARLGYEGEFEKLSKNGKTLYFAQYERYGTRTFAGYILNDSKTGGIEAIYKIDCQDEKEKECKENEQNDKERAMKWMESVEFLDNEEDTE